ncbi:MAG: DegT/DnrJ/EryC1/StrS family aminotransferase, partial [Proteobacteria bacterium]|nr:DegT/DnrJ/EryC1/StrS family aminotransferase [Pseudomonadota bacterium]
MGRDPLRAGAATGPAADPDPIPLVDLQASYRPIQSALLREFEAILGEMNLLLGPRTQALEREFARHCECEHGVAVSSGTDALRAALEAYG